MTHDLIRNACALFVLAAATLAQDVPKQDVPKKEIVSFSFSNSQSTPSEYFIQLSNHCSATFTEKGGDENEELVKQPDEDDSAPVKPPKKFVKDREKNERPPKRFPMTARTCQEVFDLARAANYFADDVQFRKHRVAYTGDRILGYFAPGVSHKAVFTWSENPNVQKLVAIFEGTAATLEAVPKLEKAYKFDKLGLNDVLKGLESQAQNGYLQEMRLLGPVLKPIAGDPKVMNIARRRAQKLLDLSQVPVRNK